MERPGIRYERSDLLLLGAVGLVVLVWNVISWRFPFFWDTVLHSKTASWYLETGFAQVTVPEALDAGHPPGFNLWLAGMWQLFGRTLVVSHAAMLPFLMLLVVQYHRLAMRWLGPVGRVWAMGLLLCEPTFLAQAGMVSADIALVAGLLLAVNAALDRRIAVGGVYWRRTILLVLGMALMAAVSFRGILMVGLVAVMDAGWAWANGAKRLSMRALLPYGLVGLLVAVWIWVHWRAVGWVMSPPAETYGGQRQVLGVAGIARNVALMGWRVMDFGRVALWVMVVAGLLALGWKQVRRNPGLTAPGWAAVVVFVGLGLLFAPISNPPGHRYFMAGYLLLILVGVGVAEAWRWKPLAKVGLVIVGLFMATGHLWIYPRGVAQGWDATLAHLPGFRLQVQVDEYLSSRGVLPSQVCADFPWLHAPEDTRLVPVRPGGWWRNYLEERECPWVVASNLNNGFSDADWMAFDDGNVWEAVQEFHSGGIWMKVLRRK